MCGVVCPVNFSINLLSEVCPLKDENTVTHVIERYSSNGSRHVEYCDVHCLRLMWEISPFAGFFIPSNFSLI